MSANKKKSEDATRSSRSKKPQSGKHSGHGYCPRCGSGWVIKKGATTNAGSERPRYACQSCGHGTTGPLDKPPPPAVPMRKSLPKAKRYIITAAQNATPIHKPTWETLLQAAKYYDAELVVIPGRYKNPTSQWTQKNQANEWWAPEVVPYLCASETQINSRLVILGDVKIQWASRRPLNDMDTLTKDMSGIVGHGSRAMRSVATPHHKHPKLMMTTGACTLPNYTDTKNGRLGKFHHCLGALIIEIDADAFYARQLDACKDGSFIDLDREFAPDGSKPARPALALSMGDIHHRWVLPDVVKATFTASDSLVHMTDPRNLFWHDVLDFYARNHHHEGNWLIEWGKWKFGLECVRTEVDNALRFVLKHTPIGRKSFVVRSNHDLAMDKWILRSDPRKDPVNMDFLDECRIRARRNLRLSAESGLVPKDAFASYGEEFLKNKRVHFLQGGEPKTIGRVEYSFHGDKGPNGSRGTSANLSKIGVKVSKGHNHTAEIIQGCYSSGKSTGMLEYEIGGPSSHTNSHILQYANNKRTIITIINGRYCLPRPKK